VRRGGADPIARRARARARSRDAVARRALARADARHDMPECPLDCAWMLAQSEGRVKCALAPAKHPCGACASCAFVVSPPQPQTPAAKPAKPLKPGVVPGGVCEGGCGREDQCRKYECHACPFCFEADHNFARSRPCAGDTEGPNNTYSFCNKWCHNGFTKKECTRYECHTRKHGTTQDTLPSWSMQYRKL
jgi:hypothetical protein